MALALALHAERIRTLRGLVAAPTVSVLSALVLVGLAFSLATPHFLDVDNLVSVSRQMAVLGLLSVGVTFVLIGGQFDLSVGAVYGFTGMLFAWAVTHGYPIGLSVLAVLLVGAAVGATNGILSSYLQLPAFIVTLGMMQLLIGATLLMTGGATIGLFAVDGAGFRAFLYAGQGHLLDVFPMQFVILVAIVIVAVLVMAFTRFGLQLYAVGGNTRAAHLAGIPVARVQTVTFIVSALLATVGGLLGVAFIASASPRAGGPGLAFEAFAAAVLGGVSLFGGAGSVVGAVLGAGLLAVLRNGLVLIGVSPFIQIMVTGAVLIAAIAVNVVITRRDRLR